MDILIKNMEMPKSCYSEVYSENGYCPFHCFDYHGGSHCTISACKCLKTRRPKDCPLILVPEHGRLIDADALPIKDEWSLVGTDVIWNAPTVLEANT